MPRLSEPENDLHLDESDLYRSTSRHQTSSDRGRRRGGSRPHTELATNACDMMLDCANAEEQGIRNFRIGHPRSQQVKNFGFAGGERVCSRMCGAFFQVEGLGNRLAFGETAAGIP